MKRALLIAGVVALGFAGCRKGPGPGGKGSIRGNVVMQQWVEVHCDNWTPAPPDPYIPIYVQEQPAVGEDVYLIYGDDEFYSDKTETDIDGNFEFPYLLKGNYKVFVYSDDPDEVPPCCTCSRNKVRKITSITLANNKDEVELSTFTIEEFDN